MVSIAGMTLAKLGMPCEKKSVTLLKICSGKNVSNSWFWINASSDLPSERLAAVLRSSTHPHSFRISVSLSFCLLSSGRLSLGTWLLPIACVRLSSILFEHCKEADIRLASVLLECASTLGGEWWRNGWLKRRLCGSEERDKYNSYIFNTNIPLLGWDEWAAHFHTARSALQLTVVPTPPATHPHYLLLRLPSHAHPLQPHPLRQALPLTPAVLHQHPQTVWHYYSS